uniref:Protein containing nitrogen-fixing NifU domain n=1 Tax=uncultured Flavobacteriia bacterium TaxID=212695 RepID=H6RFX1_9BACT|nr:nitrogen fixation protein NifU [uncultured bacterium]CCF99932.1 protein containing nitrogen-fixing NifU domain [uncultured Flavobacteriia bacterium]
MVKESYSIYAESTPNPATMKFVANRLLIDAGSRVELGAHDDLSKYPIAARLFSFPFITKVFMSDNFIALNKTEHVEWSDVHLELREYIANYLTAGHPIEDKSIDLPKEVVEAKELVKPEGATEERIVSILDDHVRPAVAADGGAIDFKSFEDGKLTLTLKGACSGCPSSTLTLKSGIENIFKQMMPEIKEIVAEEE